ncbi:MAG: arginine--tRNA ligase [Alphaproteobacteria bacterium]|nr:arginine--tRNA ligase [Alphaproteobacteria bacterium]
MTPLLAELSAIAAKAFVAEGFLETLGFVQRSDRPDLAQFQCNGALSAAKPARLSPRAVADRIASRLRAVSIFSKVEIAGPGFINLDVRDEVLLARLLAFTADKNLGAPRTGESKTAILDFGGPNVAKPMHVGHLRSAIIGDSLQRIFRANGWTVISDVHLGDWGLQMGQLISEIGHRGLASVYFDRDFSGPYPAESPVSMSDLEDIYPAASAACKSDPSRLEEARLATAELQAGRAGYRALWQHFVNVSEQGLTREYGSLGICFDLWKGEASVEPLIGPMIADLKARGLATESEGALILPIDEPGDRKELPPLILLKSDGAVLYGTTDLATIMDRVRSYHPELILYVVDQRQHTHFEQVFRAARKASYTGNITELEHAGFGTMNGPDGKPFKTRAGGVMKLYDLITMATEEAEKRLSEAGFARDYPEDEGKEIARKVGIAALKFADLSNHRVSDYVFDLTRFTRFEGKTGPYLQYACVRMRSILAKAAEAGPAPEMRVILSTPAERALILQLLMLPSAMAGAEHNRAPNILCDYVFTLAQIFNRFYTEHHIMSEKDEGVRSSRLALVRLTLSVLTKGLNLLGIEVPDRM